MVARSFLKCGITNSLDGSEDDFVYDCPPLYGTETFKIVSFNSVLQSFTLELLFT